MTDEVDNQAIEPAGALTSEQLSEVLATESEPSEVPGEGAEPEPEAKTEDDAETPEADGEKDADAESDKGEPEESEKEEQPKKRLSGSERLKRRLAAAEAELQNLRSRSGDGEISKEAVEKLIGPPPKEEDFKGDFLAYERALTVYEMRKANAADRVREQSVQAKTARQTALREAAEAHAERIEEFRSKVKDFDATLKAASNLKAAPHVEEMILDSDKSAHLVYHLAKNPDRLARLNEMSERDAAREIGRIESRLTLPQPKKQTEAPPPAKSLKGGAAPSSPEAELGAWLTQKYGKQA